MRTYSQYLQEINKETGQHRIVCGERCSPWALYTQIAMLDHFVSVSAYYAKQECILSCHEFCELIAVRN